jgi:uncharacterized membrane protein HdeD (DUF308 family)
LSAVVVIVGLLILGIGIVILISPAKLKRTLHIFLQRQWWHFVTVIRILIGILFVMAASETRAPSFVRVIGIMFILAGVAIPLVGFARIERLANWWLQRSDGILRLWALVASAFGAAVLWCGL